MHGENWRPSGLSAPARLAVCLPVLAFEQQHCKTCPAACLMGWLAAIAAPSSSGAGPAKLPVRET